MNLSNPQKELLDLIYNVILNQETTEKERKAGTSGTTHGFSNYQTK